jgi:hypothetical protein
LGASAASTVQAVNAAVLKLPGVLNLLDNTTEHRKHTWRVLPQQF